MTATHFLAPVRAHSLRQDFWSRVRDLLCLRMTQFAHARRVRRAVEEMMALDDRMLADIGINRGSIESAARYGRQALREKAPLGLRLPIDPNLSR